MAKSQVGEITRGEISRFPCTFMYIYYTRLDYIHFLTYNYVHLRPNYALCMTRNKILLHVNAANHFPEYSTKGCKSTKCKLIYVADSCRIKLVNKKIIFSI